MIKEKLNTLPDEISKKRIQLLEMAEVKEDLKSQMKKWEAEKAMEIANAVDAAGKALYSNADKRAMALDKAKETDENFKNSAKELETLETRYSLAVIELQHMCDTQSNLRAIAMLEGTNE